MPNPRKTSPQEVRIGSSAHRARAALPAMAVRSWLSAPGSGGRPRGPAPAGPPAPPGARAGARCGRGRRASGRGSARGPCRRSCRPTHRDPGRARLAGRYSPASLLARSRRPAGPPRPAPVRPSPRRRYRPPAGAARRARPGHRRAPGQAGRSGPAGPGGDREHDVEQRKDLREPAHGPDRDPVVAGRLGRDRGEGEPQQLGRGADERVCHDHGPAAAGRPMGGGHRGPEHKRQRRSARSHRPRRVARSAPDGQRSTGQLWGTRTHNPSVNSRMLCRLSYPRSLPRAPQGSGERPRHTLSGHPRARLGLRPGLAAPSAAGPLEGSLLGSLEGELVLMAFPVVLRQPALAAGAGDVVRAIERGRARAGRAGRRAARRWPVPHRPGRSARRAGAAGPGRLVDPTQGLERAPSRRCRAARRMSSSVKCSGMSSVCSAWAPRAGRSDAEREEGPLGRRVRRLWKALAVAAGSGGPGVSRGAPARAGEREDPGVAHGAGRGKEALGDALGQVSGGLRRAARAPSTSRSAAARRRRDAAAR